MMFRDILGQDEVKQQLVEMVAHNRLSHALIFMGKEGTGTLPLALAFAEYVSLLPQNNGVDLFGIQEKITLPSSADEADLWMQKQPSFSKSEQLVHPDIHFSYRVV